MHMIKFHQKLEPPVFGMGPCVTLSACFAPDSTHHVRTTRSAYDSGHPTPTLQRHCLCIAMAVGVFLLSNRGDTRVRLVVLVVSSSSSVCLRRVHVLSGSTIILMTLGRAAPMERRDATAGSTRARAPSMPFKRLYSRASTPGRFISVCIWFAARYLPCSALAWPALNCNSRLVITTRCSLRIPVRCCCTKDPSLHTHVRAPCVTLRCCSP